MTSVTQYLYVISLFLVITVHRYVCSTAPSFAVFDVDHVFTVETTPSGTSVLCDIVTLTDANFAVVWIDNDLLCFTAVYSGKDRNLLAGPIRVSSDGQRFTQVRTVWPTATALSDGKYVVIWTQSSPVRSLFGRVFSYVSGNLVPSMATNKQLSPSYFPASPTTTSDLMRHAHATSLPGSDTFAVTYAARYSTTDPAYYTAAEDIHVQFFQFDGNDIVRQTLTSPLAPSGEEIIAHSSGGDQYAPHVALFENDIQNRFVVTWFSASSGFSTQVYVPGVGGGASPAVPFVFGSGPALYSSIVAISEDRYAVCWVSGNVACRVLSIATPGTITKIGPATQPIANENPPSTGRSVRFPDVFFLQDGYWVVAWQLLNDETGTANDATFYYMQLFDINGNKMGNNLKIFEESHLPVYDSKNPIKGTYLGKGKIALALEITDPGGKHDIIGYTIEVDNLEKVPCADFPANGRCHRCNKTGDCLTCKPAYHDLREKCRKTHRCKHSSSSKGKCAATPKPFSSHPKKASDDETKRRTIPEGDLNRDVCVNEYWTVAINLQYELQMYGEGIANDYLVRGDIGMSDAVTIDTSSWGSYPEKVACTRTSVFVLTNTGDLFYMGRNVDHEIPGDSEVTSFTKASKIENARNIFASHHAMYVLLTDSVNFGNCYIHTMMAIGRNTGGSLGIGSMIEHTSGVFYNVSTSFVSELSSTFGDCFPFDENKDGEDDVITPRVKAMDAGLWLTLKVKWGNISNFTGILYDDSITYVHLYSGKSHPSTNENEVSLTRVDFSVPGSVSELTNSDPIDWVDRIIGGCLYLISQDKIYVSGDYLECGDGPGMDPNPYHLSAPFDIEDYGDYKGERIFDFVCAHSCYVLTEESLYVWGLTENGIGLDAVCDNNDCKKPTLASKNVTFVVPGLGHFVPNSEAEMERKYDLMYFEKVDPFRVKREDQIYQFAPELLADSGMADNVLTLSIRKPSVFMQLESSLEFSSTTITTADPRCNFPDVGVSEWRISHSNSYDYFELSLPWSNFSSLCAVSGPVNSTEEYDYYYTRLTFTEIFFRGMLFERELIATEEFFIDIEIRFPKQILNTEITVQQDAWSEYWDAYIIDKTFDRDTRMGEIQFTVVTRKPNFFVFADVAHDGLPYHHLGINEDGRHYRKTERLSSIEPPENQKKFRIESNLYQVTEVGGSSEPEDPATTRRKRRSYSCDEKHCYQDYELKFAIMTDERICYISRSEFPVNFVSFCDVELMSSSYSAETLIWSGTPASEDHADCVLTSREVTFSIFLEIENLCNGELFETITTIFELFPYHDWTYEEIIDTETYIFEVGEWIYFKAVLTSEKVTIEDTKVDRLEWVDDQGTTSPLMVDESVTNLGTTCGLVIDDLGLPNTIGFHFKLVNEILNLQPDQKKTYTVKTYLAVRYQGNTFDVKPVPEGRRRGMRLQGADASFGQTFVEKGIDLQVLNQITDDFSVVPYVFGVLVIVGVALMLGICMFAVVLTCVFSVVRVRNQIIKDEKEESSA